MAASSRPRIPSQNQNVYRRNQVPNLCPTYAACCAIDSRQPRDGRIIEELGSYDPTIKDTDERVKFKPDRVKYWLSVGAQPSENVAILLKKYLAKWEEREAQAAAGPAAPAPAPAEPAQAAPPA